MAPWRRSCLELNTLPSIPTYQEAIATVAWSLSTNTTNLRTLIKDTFGPTFSRVPVFPHALTINPHHEHMLLSHQLVLARVGTISCGQPSHHFSDHDWFKPYWGIHEFYDIYRIVHSGQWSHCITCVLSYFDKFPILCVVNIIRAQIQGEWHYYFSNNLFMGRYPTL